MVTAPLAQAQTEASILPPAQVASADSSERDTTSLSVACRGVDITRMIDGGDGEGRVLGIEEEHPHVLLLQDSLSESRRLASPWRVAGGKTGKGRPLQPPLMPTQIPPYAQLRYG